MAENFITTPFETDPDQLAEDAFDYLRSQVENFEPTPGDLATVQIESTAFLLAELMLLATDVPTAIFRTLGAKLHKLPPQEATRATADSTWTMVDNAGYLISAGTQVGIPTADGELLGFEVSADVEVLAGSTATAAGEVLLVALEEGEAGSGLSGTPELVEGLIYVDSIALVGQTTGGVDAESDDDYLDRLSAELELLAPRPILASDYAVMARRVAGVERATAVDGYEVGTNEVQILSVAGATSGFFRLTGGPLGAGVSGLITYNFNALGVEARLEDAAGIEPGDVLVTGGPLNTAPVYIEFRGQFASQNVGQMSVTAEEVEPGGATITVSTQQQGAVELTGAERTVTVALVDEAGEPVSGAIKEEVQSLLEERREVNFIVRVIDPTYTEIDVTFSAVAWPGWDPEAVEAQAEDAVRQYLDPANWGQPPLGQSRLWHNETKVRLREVEAVVNGVEGLHYIDGLEIGIDGEAAGTDDLDLEGVAPLPRVADINAAVSVP